MTDRTAEEIAEAEFEAARELATKFNREHRSERARIDALQARVRELEARLEIDFCWEYRPTDPEANDKGMVRVEIPPEKRREWPDGIECRNDTIKGQDENIDRLRAALTAERQQREALEARVKSLSEWKQAAGNALDGLIVLQRRAEAAEAALATAREDALEEAAKVAEAMADKVLTMWDRPGGPPGNGLAPLKGIHVAAAIRALPAPPSPPDREGTVVPGEG